MDIMKMILLTQQNALLVTLTVVIVLEDNIINVLNVVELEISINQNVKKNVQTDGML